MWLGKDLSFLLPGSVKLHQHHISCNDVNHGSAFLYWVEMALNRDDKPDTDLTGCMVTFDADLSSLRSAIHQFGRITTSQSLLPDCHGIMDVPVMSGRSEKQVLLLL